MEPNPYESPVEAATQTKPLRKRVDWVHVLLVILVVWLCLPLLAIGGIMLLGLTGGQFGD